MLSTSSWGLLGILAIAAGSSGVLTALACRLAKRIDLVDRPDTARKAHDEPTPLMGGFALFISFALALGVAKLFGCTWIADDPRMSRIILMLLVSGGLYCAVGLWDDKFSLRARHKLLLQVLAGVPFVVWGDTIQSVTLFGLDIELGLWQCPFTLFWLVTCVNVINLVDGLDGLAATIGIIACIALAALAIMNGLFGVAAVTLVLAGSLLGFLLYNWPPAKIFLGDCGSLTIGFLVGALSIEAPAKTAAGCAMAVPLMLMGIPIFDTIMAIVRRKLNGQGIGEADRRHIHHRLQDRGFTSWQSLLAISALSATMAAGALAAAYWLSDLIALAVCIAVFGLLIAGRIFGHHETTLFFRFLRALRTASIPLLDASAILRASRRIHSSAGDEPIRLPLDSPATLSHPNLRLPASGDPHTANEAAQQRRRVA